MSGRQGGGLNCRLRLGSETIISTHLARLSFKLLRARRTGVARSYI